MTWRNRLALWCLRVLTPRGIYTANVPMEMYFTTGKSTPDDPKLVLCLDTVGRRQTIVAVVLDAEGFAEEVAQAEDGLRAWASGATKGAV